MKHAKAANIHNIIDCIEDQFILSYTDDGVGFNLSELNRNKMIGLENIESRVSILSGEMNFIKPNEGFAIRIEIPLNN